MIPVCVLTGFLGSGKTTLLAQWLKSTAFSNTAVIVNEFGEIGLDHALIETSDDTTVRLTTGCLCCAVQTDLVQTVRSLLDDRAQSQQFDRIIIETSGMADPTGICQGLVSDPIIAAHCFTEHVITTFDTTADLSKLMAFEESLKQLALADRIVLTKTDLSGCDTSQIADAIHSVNPQARIANASQARIEPAIVFDGDTYDAANASQITSPTDRWHHRVGSLCITLDEPIRAAALTLFLQALTEQYGERLLRLKGLVNIEESPGSPAVVHAVQHVLYPMQWLADWPAGTAAQTQLVLIGEQLSDQWIHALANAIITEVELTVAEPG